MKARKRRTVERGERGLSVAAQGFPARLKELRKESGLSVNAFAQRCGVPNSVMRGYLAGRGLPNFEKLVGIVSATGVSADYLLVGSRAAVDGSRLKDILTLVMETSLGVRLSEPEVAGIDRLISSMAEAVSGFYGIMLDSGKPMSAEELRRVIPTTFGLESMTQVRDMVRSRIGVVLSQATEPSGTGN